MSKDLDALLRLRLELLQKVTEVTAKIDAFKVKCPTCRCMILPGRPCPCCSEASLFVEEETP